MQKYKTLSGTEVKEIYLSKDKAVDINETSGEFPYTRGIHKSMYRSRLWTMRQYAGFGSAAEANERYKYLLKKGTTGLSVAFDLPTQMGRDSDHNLSVGEVGRVGVSISSIEDMRTLFDGISLKDVSISMTINSTAQILLGFLLVVAEEQGVDWKEVRGTVQNDLLKEYIARGTYIYPPKPATKLVVDIFDFCAKLVPQFNSISISGYHIREAGSTAVQELAFTFANAIQYVELALSRGLEFDDFAPRLAFFFNCQIDFLEEIAKFRAARKIWAKIAKERFSAKNPASMMLRFHTQTAGSSLTAQQPYNNIVRTTIEAMAAVLGGTQSLHTNSYDEALGLPTKESAEIALRTQQIIAHESGIVNSVDPFGGSYLIEEWTNNIESEVLKQIDYIDSLGGMIKAIEAGYPQSEIEKSAYIYQQEIEQLERKVVGVNSFEEVDNSSSETSEPKILKIDPKIEKSQVNRLKKFKNNRDLNKLKISLEKLRVSAQNDENVMVPIIEAIKNMATLGEISDIFREVYGEL